MINPSTVDAALPYCVHSLPPAPAERGDKNVMKSHHRRKMFRPRADVKIVSGDHEPIHGSGMGW